MYVCVYVCDFDIYVLFACAFFRGSFFFMMFRICGGRRRKVEEEVFWEVLDCFYVFFLCFLCFGRVLSIFELYRCTTSIPERDRQILSIFLSISSYFSFSLCPCPWKINRLSFFITVVLSLSSVGYCCLTSLRSCSGAFPSCVLCVGVLYFLRISPIQRWWE